MDRAEVHLHIGRMRRGLPDVLSVRPLPDYQVHYSGTVVMEDVTFAVQPAGLQKFREKGVKNVHAYVRGRVIAENGGQEPPKRKGLYREAYYNPAVTDTFVDRANGQPLSRAKAVYMVGKKVYYIPEDK